jgi:hypothetical protein
MLYFMLPLWIVPGFLDYLCHRKTKIETTSGTKESVIHALMMTEAGLPVVMGLLLEINTAVLLTMLLAFFAHWATAFWDVAYASDRREVKPNEQHVHSFLEVLPFCAVSFVLCLHWNQFAALSGAGPNGLASRSSQSSHLYPRDMSSVSSPQLLQASVFPTQRSCIGAGRMNKWD